MRRYELEKEREGSTVYFFIRDVETLDIVLLPTKYLMHKIRSKCSPNTVRRSALAILYYLEYIHGKKKELTDVYQMPYVEQTNHFVEFLYWLKAGKHTRDKNQISKQWNLQRILKRCVQVLSFYRRRVPAVRGAESPVL